MEDFTQARINMVDSQVRPSDVTDHRIIAAMLEIERDRFVPGTRRDISYMDVDLPIAPAAQGQSGRYLMAAMPFAKMLQLADIAPDDLVLDVGCGTGYSSAVLSRLAGSVVALESDENMAAIANEALPEQDVGNVAVVTGALPVGYPAEGPYDVILLNGAVPEIPQALFDQLKNGGRLVAVIAQQGIGKAWLYTRHDGHATGRPAFNANVKPLPGFEKAPSFVF